MFILKKIKTRVLSYLYHKKKDKLKPLERLQFLSYALDVELLARVGASHASSMIEVHKTTLEEFVQVLADINKSIKSDKSIREFCKMSQIKSVLVSDYLFTTSKGIYVDPIIVIKALKQQLDQLHLNQPLLTDKGVQLDNAYILEGFIIREVLPTLVTLLDVSVKN